MSLPVLLEITVLLVKSFLFGTQAKVMFTLSHTPATFVIISLLVLWCGVK
jgi:hypothetical protein